MAFVPTQKQVDALYLLLTQLVRENIKVRVIRFTKWSEINIKDWIVEVVPTEEEDRYLIYQDGKIDLRYKYKH